MQYSAPREPPSGLVATLRHLGPSFILVGSVVGSGEIILTTTLGARVGFVMLWWMLLSCAGKSIVQAELGRYTVSTGETAMRAFNRLPGKLPGRRDPVSWFIWFWFASMVPTLIGSGGIYGAAGQAASLLFPHFGPATFTVILAIGASQIVFWGNYEMLEKLMTFLVVSFTFTTLGCAVCLQYTSFAITTAEIQSGLRFEFPVVAVAAALGAYGGTGVGASDSMAYTYWCAEKGYARHVGSRTPDDDWAKRARGWIRVMQTDTLLTLLVLMCATIPFYALGAGVLNRLHLLPSGTETITMLSRMYTATLGPWASVLFISGAITVLFTCMTSGLAGYSHLFAEALTILGVVPDEDERSRKRAFRGFALGAPAIMTATYFLFESPVWMITLGGIMGALMTPIVAGAAIYLRYTRVDRRIAPGPIASSLLWLCTVIMMCLGLYAAGRILWAR